MGKRQNLTVDLPEDLAAALRAAVERGAFSSTSEAVTAVLDDLLHRYLHAARDLPAIRLEP